MSDDKLLQQDEVDALLRAAARGNTEQVPPDGVSAQDEPAGEPVPVSSGTEPADDRPVIKDSDLGTPGSGPVVSLTPEEKDALGEIGNISMGSAATTLSQLLDRKVLITSPTVTMSGKKDFLNGFNMPFLVIRVRFKEGFKGYNVLVIKLKDAIVMANLMMGGDGTGLPEDISEMEISAAAEAMNQMIGTASTSLADLLSRNINIMPPEVDVVREIGKVDIDLPFADPIVVISFRMTIEDLLDTSIMQVIDLDTAREQSELLWSKYSATGDDASTEYDTGHDAAPGDELKGNYTGMFEHEPGGRVDVDWVDLADPGQGHGIPGRDRDTAPPATPPSSGHREVPQIDPDKLNLLLDIPLRVSVVLGRTKKQIKDVLQMTPGAIVEMETLVGDPVEILVNGKLVARGEVVVVNENFGVRLTSIVSTRDRLNTLNNRDAVV